MILSIISSQNPHTKFKTLKQCSIPTNKQGEAPIQRKISQTMLNNLSTYPEPNPSQRSVGESTKCSKKNTWTKPQHYATKRKLKTVLNELYRGVHMESKWDKKEGCLVMPR